MTVAEKCNGNAPNEEHEALMKTVFEVTGIKSRETIEMAMNACKDEQGKHKIDDVIAYLVQNNTTYGSGPAVKDKQKQSLEDSKNFGVPTTVEPYSTGVIDLTVEGESDDLQKAIAASLLEQPPGVSREDQDISRILEDSLKENKPGSKRKRTDASSGDLCDPCSSLRNGNTPVGIKNVGNTCWFSSVVQTLFHLPSFRDLVLHYNSERMLQDSSPMRFMRELRSLFALMLCTKQSFVDPTNAVEILKQTGSFGSSGGASAPANAQEDVNEFKHKLFDLLEEAFKVEHTGSASSSSSSSSSSQFVGSSPALLRQEAEVDTPMKELFTAHIKKDLTSASGSTSGQEQGLVQWLLNVDGFKEIHDSLEASLISSNEVDTPGSDVAQKSVEEQWFVKLPPFLNFEFSRANFNRQLHRTEKIHDKLVFPEGIYLDRYVEKNKEIVRRKRRECKALKEQLTELQGRLDRYVNFGSGNKRFPLPEILQCTLEFASGGEPDRALSPMTAAYNKAMTGGSPTRYERMDATGSVSAYSPASMDTDMAMPPASPKKLSAALPAPRHVTNNEMKVLQECLTRWRTEVETDVKDLRSHIDAIESQIANIYEGDELRKLYYQLHSVIIHDGQAASGHYWAYVRSLVGSKQWLKFNDHVVTEADWEELERDGSGGNRNACAYSLIYVDADTLRQMQREPPSIDGAYRALPKDLRYVVDAAWHTFEREIAKGKPETPGMPIAATDSVEVEVDLRDRHALVSAEIVRDLLSDGTFSLQDGEALLPKLASTMYGTLARLASQLPATIPRLDLRLSHIAVYLMGCMELPKEVIVDNFIIDQIRRLGKLSDVRIKELAGAACQHLPAHNELFSEEICKELHVQYDTFRKAVRLFVEGAKYFHEHKHELAIPWLRKACDTNDRLLQLHGSRKLGSAKNTLAALDTWLLAHYRRLSLVRLNDMASRWFENDYEETVKAVALVQEVILPGVCDLSLSRVSADRAAIEEIREKWCNFLSNESMPEPKRLQLQSLLQALLEPPLIDTGGDSSLPHLSNEQLGASLKAEYELVIAEAGVNLQAADESKGIRIND